MFASLTMHMLMLMFIIIMMMFTTKRSFIIILIRLIFSRITFICLHWWWVKSS
jgi:hypothetical protein